MIINGTAHAPTVPGGHGPSHRPAPTGLAGPVAPPGAGQRPNPASPLSSLGVETGDLTGFADAIGQSPDDLRAALGDDPTLGDLLGHALGSGADPMQAMSALRTDIAEATGVEPPFGAGPLAGLSMSPFGSGQPTGQLPTEDHLSLLLDALGEADGERDTRALHDRLAELYERHSVG